LKTNTDGLAGKSMLLTSVFQVPSNTLCAAHIAGTSANMMDATTVALFIFLLQLISGSTNVAAGM
jgi:hypothetical protein